jgi:hypothetical protein
MRFARGLGLIVAILGQTCSAAAAERVECREWQACRQLALQAAEQGEYETFHDLAWRAIQTGPTHDPDLMYLLARAQSLSGRLLDALVTLRRLIAMGVVTDAATHDDFRRVRALARWAEIEPLLAGIQARDEPAETMAPVDPRVAAPDPSASLPVPPLSAALPPAAASPSPVIEPHPAPRIEEALRLAGRQMLPGGLAYDVVSRRFAVGDLHARKIVVIDEVSGRAVDLVRADSAGFHDIAAFEIDPRRGDLWVVTGSVVGGVRGDDALSGVAALHRLQVSSGRPLDIFHLAPEHRPARFSDLTVASNGTVVVLDTDGRRLFRIRPGARALDLVVPLDVVHPASLTAAGDEVVYVAHGTGIVRVDLATRAVARVRPATGIDLESIQWIRWHHGSLVAMQAEPDATRRVIRLRLDRPGRTVVAVDVIVASVSAPAGAAAATLAGDSLYYIANGPDAAGAPPTSDGDTIVRRVRLR